MSASVRPVTDALTADERRNAAAGDLTVLAVMMTVGAIIFSSVNVWVGTMSWIAAAATVSSTLLTTIGLISRNDSIAAVVKVSFGVGGLAAPACAVAGLILVSLGFFWGWALLAGAFVYFGFSLLGLEILHRAEDTGVIDPV